MGDKVNVNLLADAVAKILSKRHGVEIVATVTKRELEKEREK